MILSCLLASPDIGHAADTEEAAAPLPIEFQPYRISVRISSDAASPLGAWLAADLRHDLPDMLERTLGSVWTIEWLADAVAAKDAASPALQGDIPADRVAEETTPAALPSSGDTPATGAAPQSPIVPVAADVAYEIHLSGRPALVTATVQAREPLWNHHSPVITIGSADGRDMAARILTSMARLFRPRAAWEFQDADHVRLRVQGAALAVDDPDLPLLRPNEAFAPWIIFRGRDGSPQRVVPVPWTLCILEENEQGRGSARVVSGLRNPLASRPRGRVELLAVAARAQWEGSELELVTTSAPPHPLVAHQVTIFPDSGIETEPAAGADVSPVVAASELRLISDRRGRVRIEADSSAACQWVRVVSGDQVLAEVPVVAGASPTLRLELADDLLRLRAEGQLRLLQGELIAVVAERTALMLACRAAAKRNAWTEVDGHLGKLTSLPTTEQLRERVTGIRVPAVAEARKQRDKLTERRVQRMCDETEELLRRHLADDKLHLLQEEMAELKSASVSE